jgi:hypothetical protein
VFPLSDERSGQIQESRIVAGIRKRLRPGCAFGDAKKNKKRLKKNEKLWHRPHLSSFGLKEAGDDKDAIGFPPKDTNGSFSSSKASERRWR